MLFCLADYVQKCQMRTMYELIFLLLLFYFILFYLQKQISFPSLSVLLLRTTKVQSRLLKGKARLSEELRNPLRD